MIALAESKLAWTDVVVALENWYPEVFQVPCKGIEQALIQSKQFAIALSQFLQTSVVSSEVAKRPDTAASTRFVEPNCSDVRCLCSIAMLNHGVEGGLGTHAGWKFTPSKVYSLILRVDPWFCSEASISQLNVTWFGQESLESVCGTDHLLVQPSDRKAQVLAMLFANERTCKKSSEFAKVCSQALRSHLGSSEKSLGGRALVFMLCHDWTAEFFCLINDLRPDSFAKALCSVSSECDAAVTARLLFRWSALSGKAVNVLMKDAMSGQGALSVRISSMTEEVASLCIELNLINETVEWLKGHCCEPCDSVVEESLIKRMLERHGVEFVQRLLCTEFERAVPLNSIGHSLVYLAFVWAGEQVTDADLNQDALADVLIRHVGISPLTSILESALALCLQDHEAMDSALQKVVLRQVSMCLELFDGDNEESDSLLSDLMSFASTLLMPGAKIDAEVSSWIAKVKSADVRIYPLLCLARLSIVEPNAFDLRAVSLTKELECEISQLMVDARFVNLALATLKVDLDAGLAKLESRKEYVHSVKFSPSSLSLEVTVTKDELMQTLSVRLDPTYPLRTLNNSATHFALSVKSNTQLDMDCRSTKIASGSDEEFKPVANPSGFKAKKGYGTAMLKLTHTLKSAMAEDGIVEVILSMWIPSVEYSMAGVEPCRICFCQVHFPSKNLPGRKCTRCKNDFHSQCLLQWFSTSGKTSCPMCLNPFVSIQK